MFGYGGSEIEANLLFDIKQLLEEILKELKKEK